MLLRKETPGEFESMGRILFEHMAVNKGSELD